MKALCREVIKLHYRDELNPEIQHCHNSSQREEAIADNVKKLVDESLFLQGPLDTNVISFVMNDQPC